MADASHSVNGEGIGSSAGCRESWNRGWSQLLYHVWDDGTKMSLANVNHLCSIEQAYPRSAFDEDAGSNSRPKAEIFHGVRITSTMAADGSFELSRASRQVGEIDAESDTVFLFPELVLKVAARPEADSDYGSGDPQPHTSSPQDETASYRAFLTRIGEAARTATFKPAIGRGEERLRGFHGG